MRNSIKTFLKKETGFSLVEIAIVLLILGLMITPAINMYHQYRVEKDWNETEDNIDLIALELGGYRAITGRFPCPAPTDAVPGDFEYGHEFDDCLNLAPPVNSCANGLCRYNNPESGRDVVIGSVPFKTLNLQESESYDSALARISYAVTLNLTDNTTFDINGGGIAVVDKIDPTLSLVSPNSSAHFVVIAHGHNKAGAYSRQGAIINACNTTSLIEQENCDDDAVFISGEYDLNNFDDLLTFYTPVEPSEWQISQAQPTAITLKNTNSMAVGANIGQDLSAADTTTVLQIGADSGAVRSAGRVVTDRICEYGALTNGDCFEPRLLAGSLTSDGTRLEDTTNPGSGISCYDGAGQDEYMMGIANNQPLCTDEIYAQCPAGQFMDGVDTDGNIVCIGAADDRCFQQNVTGFCGGSFNIGDIDNGTNPGTASGSFLTEFEGECRMITDYNAAYFATQIAGMSSYGQVQGHINSLNGGPRNVVTCASGNDSQVRNAYRCDSGTFNLIRAHEKKNPNQSFPANLTTTGSSWPAENGYNGSDPHNNNYYHDCWCREDYRVQSLSCPGGLSGVRVRVQKHRCPQTSHVWETVYQTDQFCACSPGTTTTNQSCNSYYDEVNGTTGTTGLTGTVTKTYDINCVAGVPVTDPTPSDIDDDSCACASNSQIVNRTYCPFGTTNSWSWPGGSETGVETLSTQTWICPTSTSGGLPDPGFWGPVTPYSPIPACTCDPGLDDIEVESCPAGLEGTGIVYRKEWDCTLNAGLGGWEDQADWDLIANNCNGCVWQAPAGAPSLEEYAYGSEKGSTCSCGSSAAAFCHDFAGGGQYSVWTGCPCVVQP